MNKMNNLILFPSLRRSLEELEEESYILIEEHAYEQALDNINELLSHQYSSFEINVNKIHCLTKLGRLLEAEEFSEELLSNEEDDYYYDYLGYYIMILYEQNNFNALMSTISEEEKKRKIPPPFDKKFRDIYRLCYQMNTMKANDILHEFENAVQEENHQKQWKYIQKWIQLNIEPSEIIINALKHKKIHPVIKTKLIETFIERNLVTELTVEKFGQQIEVRPHELTNIEAQMMYLKTINELAYLEQQNPTLYNLIHKILYQYHYVRFPFLEKMEDRMDLRKHVEALIYVGKKNLSLEAELNDELRDEVDWLEFCSHLYLNLIDE